MGFCSGKCGDWGFGTLGFGTIFGNGYKVGFGWGFSIGGSMWGNVEKEWGFARGSGELEKLGKLVGFWGQKWGVFRVLFCSQCLKELPIGFRQKSRQPIGFFRPLYLKKFIFFGVLVYNKDVKGSYPLTTEKRD